MDAFLTLLPVEDGTASGLHKLMDDYFNAANIDYKKMMIGFAADGANVMMGNRNSLSVLLKNDNPGLFITKCVCHSFDLCASYTCKTFPRWVEDLARDMYNYFLSYKQAAAYKHVQKLLDVRPHKMLHPCQTRWLSLHAVVERLIEQYPALVAFFEGHGRADRLLDVDAILSKLKDPTTKLYLHFLVYVLPLFTTLNKEMQAEGTTIHVLYDRISTVLRTIVEGYLKPQYLRDTPLDRLQHRDPSNFAPLEEIYLGGRVMSELSKPTDIDPAALHNFRLRCLEFCIEGASQVIKRFPLGNVQMKRLEAIDPRSVLEKRVPSVAPLAASFPSLVMADNINKLDTEWRHLRNTDLGLPVDARVEHFWRCVRETKQGDGTAMFPTLSDFVSKLLCLPHSSANVERVFSQINLVKTKTRNSLETGTVQATLHTKQGLVGAKCYNFPVQRRHIDLMRKGQFE